MPRSRARRWAPLAPLLLLALLAPLAAAQDAAAAPTERVYDLYQFGNRLGETGLSERNVVDLDPEKRAAMANNLMVALTSEHAATPVVNAGTLYG